MDFAFHNPNIKLFEKCKAILIICFYSASL